MKETYPSLAKEIEFWEVQEAQGVPIIGRWMNTPRHIIINMSKFKDKKNLKSSKRKAESYLQRSSHKTVS